MKNIKSKVMTIANRLVKQGMSRSLAMIKAWIIAKAPALRVKVKGTSYRQNALEELHSGVSAVLKRDHNNAHDINAVAVYAAEKLIGYLPRTVAAILAPLMDKGAEPKVTAFSVTGGFNPFVNLGAQIAVRV